MQRREFITLFGGAVAAWPIVAHAQQFKGPARIGLLPLGSKSNAYDRSLVEAFRQGLADAGLVENRDVVPDIAWTRGEPPRGVDRALARGICLVVACGSSASVAAAQLTST